MTNPATLTNVGVPEYEVFFFHQGGSPSQSSQVQTPVMVKYTWAKQWQICVGTNGYTQVKPSPSDPTATALGDPNVTVKYLYLPQSEHGSAQSVQLTYGFPVSPVALGISTGRPATSLTWLYSRPLGKDVGCDVNLWGTALTDGDGVSRLQFNQSGDVNWQFAKGWTYTLEYHHFGSAGAQFPDVSAVQHLLSYAVAPSCTLCAGVELGLNPAAPRQTWMTGVIFLIDPGHGHASR